MSKKKDEGKVTPLEKEKDKRTITVPDEDTQFLPFTAVPNEIIDDPRIIPTGKLLMVYLLKHAGIPGWQYQDSAMYKFLECGRDKLEAAFKSLRQAGYVTTIIKYDDKGRVCGSKRIFSRTPKYLELNKSKLKIVPKATADEGPLEALKSRESIIDRCPEIQGTGDQGTLNQGLLQIKTIKNKNIKKQQTRPSPIQPKPEPQNPSSEPDPNVVVSLMEKLEQWAIAEVLVRTWLRKHSAEYILCKIEYTKSYATKNPAGLLRRAIENDYKLPLCKQAKLESEASAEPAYPTHEENLAWYAGLSDEEKLALQKEAVHKHSMFEHHLEHQGMSVLDQGFMQNGLFKDMMALIGRTR